MKLLLWFGNEVNQRALANKLAEEFEVVGIVTESRKKKRKLTLGKIYDKIYEKLFLSQIAKAWFGMKEYYSKEYSSFPEVPKIDVENINSAEALAFSQEKDPDLILVSGTRMIREKLLAINPTVGILNLHTGISPYIKGGPNCTNWCISTGQYHLIGNTIMWIDKGIDTGRIVASEFTPLSGEEGLGEIHIKVMEHAHDLYIRSILQMQEENIIGVSQNEISKGKTYYTREWKLKQKIQLVKNLTKFRMNFKEGKIDTNRTNIKTIGLKGDG